MNLSTQELIIFKYISGYIASLLKAIDWLPTAGASLVAQIVKNLLEMQETRVQFLG